MLHEMSELVHFILAHEEAFQSRGRVASLYADFRSQSHTNPEGYQANLAIWQKALADAVRAGVVPAPGAARHLLTIHTGRELARALQHKDYGVPTCLPAVFQDAMRKRSFVLDTEFIGATTSIYKRSWVPSAKDVLQWGWKVLTGPDDPDRLPVGTFVVVHNVEAAAAEVLKRFQAQPQISAADRILSRPAFLKRFASVLNETVPITADDLDILLTHLSRDRQALAFSDRAVKFKAEIEEAPAPITDEDVALADLRDCMDKVNAQLPILHAKIVTLDQAAREAVQQTQMVRAKTALRSRKLAESALAHRSALALQLEEAYMKLQQAADQIDVVEAMKAGADAMDVLNQKVGGAEGAQNIMDAVNEQMTTVDEIASIINESATPVNEEEVDDEFETMEKAEKEKREQEEAAKTATRLAELAGAEKIQKEKEAQREEEQERKRHEAAMEESEVAETSTDFSQLSVEADGEEEKMLVAA
ncbi:hypothetical protein K458DRAFT_328827 [Lentithecium fluviatile CBS 122367]|uniref:Snf7-domain-containing protein n=1 Tax=Lentithecium fluviatile CBS 122367 TaxID=1168545 RepID=A0A6G1JJP7_9PLEO|nr:hypothetical protein K458DRAFT_328827 [Lentithecium fluviatile CBS 122367]